MKKAFPEAYDFCPPTYVLPYEMNLLKQEFIKKVDKTKESPEKKDPNNATIEDKTLGVDGKANPANEGTLEKSLQTSPAPTTHRIHKKERSRPNIEKKEKLEKKIFIVKPECESQGKGIFLTKTWEDIDPREHLVA